MDLAHIGPAFPLIALPIVGVALFFYSRDKAFASEHGRIAVQQFIERRGQTLVSLKARPLVIKPMRGELSGATMLFDAVARMSDGEERIYRLAFDAEGGNGQNSGLKQYNNGAWRDAL